MLSGERLEPWFSNFFVPFPLSGRPATTPSPRGQWLPVGRREAFNGKNFNENLKIFNVDISSLTEIVSFLLGGMTPQLGTVDLEDLGI